LAGLGVGTGRRDRAQPPHRIGLAHRQLDGDAAGPGAGAGRLPRIAQRDRDVGVQLDAVDPERRILERL
jgi:hypothetical protein